MTASTPVHITDWTQVVRGEFAEMPGLRLTRPQAQRLWAMDPVTCEALLDELVDAGFLRRTRDGVYLKADSDR